MRSSVVRESGRGESGTLEKPYGCAGGGGQLAARTQPLVGFGGADQDSGKIKILQTERKYVVLVNDGAQTFAVKWDLLVSVQSLSRCTGEVYASAVRRSGLGPKMLQLATRFERQQRVLVTDGDSGVARGERAATQSLAEWDCLHVVCQVHKVHNGRSSMMDQVSRMAQRLTHFCLSLREPSALSKFRMCLREVIAERLHYLPGRHPSRSTIKAHTQFLDTVLPSTILRYRYPRAVILNLANGDWNDDRVVHLCAGCCDNEDDCKRRFSEEFIKSVVTPDLLSFPSRNWKNCEGSPGIVCLLIAIHNLLPQAFVRWASRAEASPEAGSAGVARAPYV
jgi:hypothetical protein